MSVHSDTHGSTAQSACSSHHQARPKGLPSPADGKQCVVACLVDPVGITLDRG